MTIWVTHCWYGAPRQIYHILPRSGQKMLCGLALREHRAKTFPLGDAVALRPSDQGHRECRRCLTSRAAALRVERLSTI